MKRLLVEQRVDYDEWVPEGYGTADAVVVNGRSLHIVDLKYGVGNKVDAINNPQLRLYALGAIQQWGFEHGIESVSMTIVQPRLDHISTETLKVEELLEWGEWVKERAKATEDPTAPATPGPEQCQWCKARKICRARAIHALTVVGSDHLAPADLASLLHHVPTIKGWIKDVEAGAMEALEKGDTLPGLKLVEGRSVRTLTDDAGEILYKAGLDWDTIYRRSFAPLGHIEKALGGKKKAAPILEQCTTKPPGKPSITHETDPRPPISATVDHFPTGE